jgi:hypothetical protein
VKAVDTEGLDEQEPDKEVGMEKETDPVEKTVGVNALEPVVEVEGHCDIEADAVETGLIVPDCDTEEVRDRKAEVVRATVSQAEYEAEGVREVDMETLRVELEQELDDRVDVSSMVAEREREAQGELEVDTQGDRDAFGDEELYDTAETDEYTELAAVNVGVLVVALEVEKEPVIVS